MENEINVSENGDATVVGQTGSRRCSAVSSAADTAKNRLGRSRAYGQAPQARARPPFCAQVGAASGLDGVNEKPRLRYVDGVAAKEDVDQARQGRGRTSPTPKRHVGAARPADESKYEERCAGVAMPTRTRPS